MDKQSLDIITQWLRKLKDKFWDYTEVGHWMEHEDSSIRHSDVGCCPVGAALLVETGNDNSAYKICPFPTYAKNTIEDTSFNLEPSLIQAIMDAADSVSYTHLTLPTILLV